MSCVNEVRLEHHTEELNEDEVVTCREYNDYLTNYLLVNVSMLMGLLFCCIFITHAQSVYRIFQPH